MHSAALRPKAARFALMPIAGLLAACATPPLADPEPPDLPRLPPSEPMNAPVGDGSAPAAFAVTDLFLGGTDRQGNPSASAWKDYGFDLDGESAGTHLGHCQQVVGEFGEEPLVDGNGYIKNSFGAHVLPILSSVTSIDFQGETIKAMKGGLRTLVFDLEGLASGATESGVLSSAPLAEERVGATWALVPTDAATPPPGAFPTSYLVDGTWVSGGYGTIVVPVALRPAATGGPQAWYRLTIHHAVITMDLSPDRAEATNGMIAGVLDTSELVEEATRYATNAQNSLCNSVTLQAILDQVRDASDIMLDGTQDPTKTCNGISIGLGFNATRVQIGSEGAPIAYPDACASPPGG